MLMEHIRKQGAKPDLNQILCFAKRALQRNYSEPSPSVEEELSSVAKQKRELSWTQVSAEMRAEGQVFEAWAKTAKAWQSDRQQACYEWHATASQALELAVEEAAKRCFPVLLTEGLTSPASQGPTQA